VPHDRNDAGTTAIMIALNNRNSRMAAASLLALACCTHTRPPTVAPSSALREAQPPAATAPAPLEGPAAHQERAIDVARASQFFAEFDAMCTVDAGKLWGLPLAGSLLFVDPQTRFAVANQADADGILRPEGHLFTGVLPHDVMIANTAVAWGAHRWTMVIWPAVHELPDDARRALLAHEAFHRIQPELGLEVSNETNSHLDASDARLWLQLEWNALERALVTPSSKRPERVRAIADALAFRNKRYLLFPRAKFLESQLEIGEGLAQYTGARLAGLRDADVVAAGRQRRAGETGFARSFAYVSGPLYGYLLDAMSDQPSPWRATLTKQTNLGDLLGELAKAPRSTGSVEALSTRYDGDAIRRLEHARATARATQIAKWRKALIDGPVLILPLRGPKSGTFDPRRVYPMSDNETVFTSRTLKANWGTLEVSDSAMLEDTTLNRATVSLEGAARDGLQGDGWTLHLAPGWTLRPGPRHGDAIVTPSPQSIRATQTRELTLSQCRPQCLSLGAIPHRTGRAAL